MRHEIFSILENNFLFGNNANVTNTDKLHTKNGAVFANWKVRILAIDSAGSTDGALAAASLARLEVFLRTKSGNPAAAITDYFDVAAGSGAGGILVALLFTRERDGRPKFTAGEALTFMVQNGRRLLRTESRSPGLFWRVFGLPAANGKKKKILEKVFGEMTLRDTAKSVLIPCYDLSTNTPFLFSRADAVEMDGYDFKISDVCLTTWREVDGKTRIVGVDDGIAMSKT